MVTQSQSRLVPNSTAAVRAGLGSSTDSSPTKAAKCDVTSWLEETRQNRRAMKCLMAIIAVVQFCISLCPGKPVRFRLDPFDAKGCCQPTGAGQPTGCGPAPPPSREEFPGHQSGLGPEQPDKDAKYQTVCSFPTFRRGGKLRPLIAAWFTRWQRVFLVDEEPPTDFRIRSNGDF